QDGQSAWARNSVVGARSRRRGDRIELSEARCRFGVALDMSFGRLEPSAPHSNLASNLFASCCDSRRPIIAPGTCQSRSSSWSLQLHGLPARSRNSRSLASRYRLGSVRLIFELPSCAYLAILRAPSLPNCDS